MVNMESLDGNSVSVLDKTFKRRLHWGGYETVQTLSNNKRGMLQINNQAQRPWCSNAPIIGQNIATLHRQR